MRVIAGSAGSIPLRTVPGDLTRPTTDRIKETLFNILQPSIYGCRFLDLFAGSGAVGIEALSRGAAGACFVDNAKKSIQCIEDNLKATGLLDRAVILRQNADESIEQLSERKEYFDIVFMDPPYNHMYEKNILSKLHNTKIIDENSLIIIEASIDTDFSYMAPFGYEVVREKKYKTNKHIFAKIQ